MTHRPGLAEDARGNSSGPHTYAECPECRSADVRPSRSAYPLDKEKLAGRAASFWRCGNCGHRFVGPLAPVRSHRSSRVDQDPLRREIEAQRGRKRWLSPVIVIVTTIVVIILVLLFRDAGPLGLRLRQ